MTRDISRYQCNEIYVYVIAPVGVQFGINFTSVRLSRNKIARGEAECYLTQPNTSEICSGIFRLTVLIKINTIASLLSFKMYWYSLRSLANNIYLRFSLFRPDSVSLASLAREI